jgi:oxygen-independent coproporphyrinogen-3 oxidase
LRGAIIERLMCDHRVDLGTICQRFGAEPAVVLGSASLGPLIADGLLERQGTQVRVKPHARPLVRSIAAAFDAHLSADDQHSRGV